MSYPEIISEKNKPDNCGFCETLKQPEDLYFVEVGHYMKIYDYEAGDKGGRVIMEANNFASGFYACLDCAKDYMMNDKHVDYLTNS